MALIPKKPVSSPIIAKIESVLSCGKKLYFCCELPIPLPNNPPRAIAIKF